MLALSRKIYVILFPWARSFAHYSVEHVLSQDNLTKTVSKFQAMPSIRLHTQESLRKAAALIPVCVVDNKVSLLYTLLTSQLASHKGQVSFPGGMQEANDKNLQTTAVRETKKDLGIEENNIKIWGCGNEIITRTDCNVMPVIGVIDKSLDLKKLNINSSEIEKVFTVPIENLCRKDKIGYTQFRSGYSTPVFLGGEERIWGLTAIITHAFLKCLLPPTAYTHKMKYIEPVKVPGKIGKKFKQI